MGCGYRVALGSEHAGVGLVESVERVAHARSARAVVDVCHRIVFRLKVGTISGVQDSGMPMLWQTATALYSA